MKKCICISLFGISMFLFSSCAETDAFIDGFYKGYYGSLIDKQKKENAVDTLNIDLYQDEIEAVAIN